MMKINPSGFTGNSNRPIDKVNWHDAREYCSRFTETERRAGRLPEGFAYRLPTEAEWEYACRAGTTSPFSHGDDPKGTGLTDHAWFLQNSDSASHPVGSLKPNAWGLYDMHGNVWEWCEDVGHDAYPGGTVTNFTGSGQGWLRVARGGSWLYDSYFCRSANRDTYGPNNRCNDVGFRVVLAPVR
jgi:formylglycine-generating enzyme required for sulfatase activity